MRVLVLLPLPLALGCLTQASKTEKDGGSGTDDTGPAWMNDPPGCINVDAHGDFATIAEAIIAAPEGSAVSVCPGTYAESVVIDKTVSVTGEDVATTIITPPTNQHGFELSGAGASVANFTVSAATRSGVFINGASDVSVSNIVLDGPANYGVEASASTGVVISGVTFFQPGFGGVSVSGGSITIDGSTFDHPYGYGILARDDADLTLTNNGIEGTLQAAGDGSDGFAVFADGCLVTMSGNTITSPDIIGVYVLDGALTMNGDVVSDTAYGVVSAGPAGTVTDLENVTVTDAFHQGVYVASPDPIILNGLTVSIAAGASDQWTYAKWGGKKQDFFCGGAFIQGDDVTITNANFSGYENYSLYGAAYTGPGMYTVSDSTFRDSGRWGVVFDLVDGTADITNVTIDSIRDPEIAAPCAGFVNQSDALYGFQSNLNLDTVSITNNIGWGFTSLQGTANITNSLFDSNHCASFVNYESAGNVVGSTFTHAIEFGSIYDSEGALTVTGSTFADNHVTRVSTYDDGAGNISRYEYDYSGYDMYLNLTASADVSGNTFSQGDYGIISAGASVSVTDNTYTGYEHALLDAEQGTDTDPAIFKGNTVEDHGGYVAQAYGAFLEVEDINVGSTRPGRSGYHYYTNDVLDYEYTYESSYSAFYAAGSYYSYDDGTGNIVTVANPAGIRLTDVELGDTAAGVVSVNDARLEVSGVHAGKLGGDVAEASSYAYGVYSYSDGAPSEVIVNDLTATSVTGSAFYLYNSYPIEGYIDISDVDFGAVGYAGSSADAFQMTGNASYTISNATFADVDGSGLTNDGDYYYYDYVTSSYVYDVNTTVAIVDGLNVTSAGEDGISFAEGDLVLTNSTVSAGLGDGVYLNGASVSSSTGETIPASASITGNILTGNAGYGMLCADVTLTDCSGNDLTGNTLGDQSGCSETCGM